MTQEIATIEKSQEEGEIVVIANGPDGVRSSLSALSAQMDNRIRHWKGERATLETNLELAKKNKLRQTGILNHIRNAQRRVEFYEKLKAAFDAGYVPVPTFSGVDVFAIRTTRKKPRQRQVTGDARWGGPSFPDVDPVSPPVGEGRYVDDRPFTKSDHWEKDDGKGNKTEMVTLFSPTYDEEIDFPFALMKPQIVEATGRALAHKIFDELGVSTEAHDSHGSSLRRGDPMVIGRVVLKNGPRWSWKTVSFLVSWFIDTKDL